MTVWHKIFILFFGINSFTDPSSAMDVLSDCDWLQKQRIHVIAADDEATNRMILERHLHSAGIQVDAYENGRELLNRFSPSKYRLVLLDGDMPFMDGYQTTEQLCSLYPDVCVIAVTGNVTESERERFMRAGAKGFVEKPIEKAALWAELRKVLNTH